MAWQLERHYFKKQKEYSDLYQFHFRDKYTKSEFLKKDSEFSDKKTIFLIRIKIHQRAQKHETIFIQIPSLNSWILQNNHPEEQDQFSKEILDDEKLFNGKLLCILCEQIPK
jgi:hypothetical protein